MQPFPDGRNPTTSNDELIMLMEFLKARGLVPALSPQQASPPMEQLKVVTPGVRKEKAITDRVAPETAAPSMPEPTVSKGPFRQGIPTMGQTAPGRIPGTIPRDEASLFPFVDEAPTPGQNTPPPAPAPPMPAMPDQMTQMQPPGPVSVAPSQEGDPISALLKALAAIQPPAAPEAVRVATPPPPAKPQNEVGNLLKLMLAGGGAPGNPMLSQMLGRG